MKQLKEYEKYMIKKGQKYRESCNNDTQKINLKKKYKMITTIFVITNKHIPRLVDHVRFRKIVILLF